MSMNGLKAADKLIGIGKTICVVGPKGYGKSHIGTNFSYHARELEINVSMNIVMKRMQSNKTFKREYPDGINYCSGFLDNVRGPGLIRRIANALDNNIEARIFWVLDESQITAHAYRSMTDDVLNLLKFTSIARHWRVSTMILSQFEEQIPKHIRERYADYMISKYPQDLDIVKPFYKDIGLNYKQKAVVYSTRNEFLPFLNNVGYTPFTMKQSQVKPGGYIYDHEALGSFDASLDFNSFYQAVEGLIIEEVPAAMLDWLSRQSKTNGDRTIELKDLIKSAKERNPDLKKSDIARFYKCSDTYVGKTLNEDDQ